MTKDKCAFLHPLHFGSLKQTRFAKDKFPNFSAQKVAVCNHLFIERKEQWRYSDVEEKVTLYRGIKNSPENVVVWLGSVCKKHDKAAACRVPLNDVFIVQHFINRRALNVFNPARE